MRRLITSLTALGLLSAVLGCHHTAGICDCDLPTGPPCPMSYGPGAPMMPSAEPLKVMPKETGKDKVAPPPLQEPK